MTRVTGGPAFPVADMQSAHDVAAAAIVGVEGTAQRDQIYTEERARAMQGMTLRDYFAAAALPTCLGYEKDDIKCWVPVDFARHAYQVADAMLLERAK